MTPAPSEHLAGGQAHALAALARRAFPLLEDPHVRSCTQLPPSTVYESALHVMHNNL